MTSVKLEGKFTTLAQVEGLPDVFTSTNFTLLKSRWVSDDEVSVCQWCKNKFNQLRRKHHCRQCGNVFCSKCCNEKMPLPQLGLEDPERVCEYCRPVTEFITKSWSPHQNFKSEAAVNLVNQCGEISGLCKVVELGGVQTLISLAKNESPVIQGKVISGLQILSTHQPLHRYLAEAGAIKAICSYSASCVALEDGALEPVLRLSCTSHCNAVSLVAVSTLSLIAEEMSTHTKILESPLSVLTSVCSLASSEDEQMQEVSLKTLCFLSLGSNWQKHRIIQEDFTAGRSLQRAIRGSPRNQQVLCNAACLIANLATSNEDQGGLQDLLDGLGEVLRKDNNNLDLHCHVARGLANFARFQQNASKIKSLLPLVIFKCLKSNSSHVKMHAMRAIFNLMSINPSDTCSELLRDGAGELLEGLSRLKGLTTAIQDALLAQVPDLVKPM
uniref:Lateral signaling target protein 2-like protein n=1 Tax=Magallana gigas TaxID=29159 RepID=K1QIW8_MAGGI